MSRRVNMYGFSLRQMRRLFGSGDDEALERILNHLYRERPAEDWATEQIGAIVKQAVLKGIPFRDLGEESALHSIAAGMLAAYEQDWLITDASSYHASALEEGLWGRLGPDARPETKAFLKGLVEGVPLFGQQPPSDGSAYAAISLEKLRFFQGGLEDLRLQLEYRAGRRKFLKDEDRAAADFATQLCEWINTIIAAEKDLWFQFG